MILPKLFPIILLRIKLQVLPRNPPQEPLKPPALQAGCRLETCTGRDFTCGLMLDSHVPSHTGKIVVILLCGQLVHEERTHAGGAKD
jgi:hypothetical protein